MIFFRIYFLLSEGVNAILDDDGNDENCDFGRKLSKTESQK